MLALRRWGFLRLLPFVYCTILVFAFIRSRKSFSEEFHRRREDFYKTFTSERVLLKRLVPRLVEHSFPPITINHDINYDHYFSQENKSPEENLYLTPLLACRVKPNRFTSHIRLASRIYPISMHPLGGAPEKKSHYFNAAIVSLPYWSPNQYLLVSRIVTDGWTHASAICEANICSFDPDAAAWIDDICTEQDLDFIADGQVMRCATEPLVLNVPPTPALKCLKHDYIANSIGFLDPRIFWSGKGEPLIIMNSHSRYSCLGIWITDLRGVYPPLRRLLGKDPRWPTLGPLMSYDALTEVTRNPPDSRSEIEKNWMLFSDRHSTYVHYDIGPRTFAQLLGGGLTTPNLTDPFEIPCLGHGTAPDLTSEWRDSSWHQGTNSLQLILCERGDRSCKQSPDNTVFWSLIHQKHESEIYGLRYERFFIVWSSSPPFHMLAISRLPIIFADESVNGYPPEASWDDDEENAQMLEELGMGKGEYAKFTYTPSIAYSWGRLEDAPQDKNIGYLDDEVILGIGIEDRGQAYVRALVKDLLQCLRLCPGRGFDPFHLNFERAG